VSKSSWCIGNYSVDFWFLIRRIWHSDRTNPEFIISWFTLFAATTLDIYEWFSGTYSGSCTLISIVLWLIFLSVVHQAYYHAVPNVRLGPTVVYEETLIHTVKILFMVPSQGSKWDSMVLPWPTGKHTGTSILRKVIPVCFAGHFMRFRQLVADVCIDQWPK